MIGTRAHRVAPEDALAHVGWFARRQRRRRSYDFRWADRGSNLFAKGQDGFTPIGPAVAAAEVDPRALVLRTRVNGEVVQEDVTANLIFSFARLIADLSRFMTLEPGDVILTGTPAGSRPCWSPATSSRSSSRASGSVRSTVVEAEHDIEAWGAEPKVTPEVRAGATGEPVPRAHELTRRGVGRCCTTSAPRRSPQQLQRRGIAQHVHPRPAADAARTCACSATRTRCATSRCARTSATRTTAPLNAQKARDRGGRAATRCSSSRRASEPGAGTIGDILAARALARGATGIVTDGGLRDSPAVAGLDIPTYFQAPHGAVLGLVHYPLESTVPVTCGGVLVMPGDVMVGDAEGVVVVPAALAEEVAHDALEQELREEWALERVQAGDSRP